MSKRYSFTKDKFLSLKAPQQQKHSAALLRELYTESSFQKIDDLAKHYNTWQTWINAPLLETLTKKAIADRHHEHLIAGGVSPKESKLLPPITTGDRAEPIAPLLEWTIYLDNVRSAFNVGSIIRTTEAFSIGKVAFAKNTPTTSNKQVQSASMQSSQWIPTESALPLSSYTHPIIALDTSPDAIPHNEYPFTEAGTLILGNEEYGCSEEALKTADAIVSIPLYGRKNSLNVANAFSIIAETIRRRVSNDS